MGFLRKVFENISIEKRTIRRYVKKYLKDEKCRNRNFKNIRMLFDFTKKSEYTIDDQTWNDLVMDEVFNKIDRNYSSAGEAALYTILRNPSMNEEELLNSSRLIELFRKDNNIVVELKSIFFKIGLDNKNRLLEMITNKLPINKTKGNMYFYIGIIPLVLIACAIIFKAPVFMAVLLFYLYIPMSIHIKEANNIKSAGLIYLRKLLSGARAITRIDNRYISEETEEIKILLNELKVIDRGTFAIKIINGFGGVLEMFSIPFLVEESTYYKISKEIKNKKDIILNLYYLVGKLEALISAAIFEECNKEICTRPVFIKDISLAIEEGIHPLLKNPVSNSIAIKNKGIVLTGTNMSGKSTFLRMVSTNILLAQTFNFTMAKSYEACFFNVVSSISPKDDIKSGKSYYLSEAECILRIINSLKNEVPVFCPIDEIFRGTNPVERIAASTEILRYINSGNAICIAATHDKEICDMLKQNYDFYYFSESVDKKDGLSFDYVIKKGISKTRNAIKLLDYMGYPKAVIENSYKTIENITEYI